jgi:hypothetical protein
MNIVSKEWRYGRISAMKAVDGFKAQWAGWLAFSVIQFFSLLILSFIPFVGTFASSIVPTMFNGVGLRFMDNYERKSEEMSFELAKNALQKDGVELLGLGALQWGMGIIGVAPLIVIAIAGVFIAIGGNAFTELVNSGSIQGGSLNGGMDEATLVIILVCYFVGFVLTLCLLLLIFMMTVFVPYLIVIRGQKVIPSIKLSFKAAHRNPWSITALSLWWLLFSFAGILMCGVGILLLGPIINLSLYYLGSEIFDGPIEGELLNLEK